MKEKLITYIIPKTIGDTRYEFISTRKIFARKYLLTQDLIVPKTKGLRFKYYTNGADETIEIDHHKKEVYFPFIKENNVFLLYEFGTDSEEGKYLQKLITTNEQYLKNLIKDNRVFPEFQIFIEELEKAIENGAKAYDEAPKVKSVIYDADFDNRPIPKEEGGKVYYMDDFSACGWVAIYIKDPKYAKYLKEVSKKYPKLEISPAYGGGHYVTIAKMNYSNGLMHRLERFYNEVYTDNGAKLLGRITDRVMDFLNNTQLETIYISTN